MTLAALSPRDPVLSTTKAQLIANAGWGSCKNNSCPRIPTARHLRPHLGRGILEIPRVFLRFRSVVAPEADALLGAILTSYSCASPLVKES